MRTPSRAFAWVAAMTVASLTLAAGPGGIAAARRPGASRGRRRKATTRPRRCMDNRQGVARQTAALARTAAARAAR